jgi:WD40 repeat protein
VLQQYLATGSQDKSFSVWPQGHPKPLLVVRKAFAAGVTDIAWAPNGLTLVAVSVDGTVMSVAFSEEELGTVMDDSQARCMSMLTGRTSLRMRICVG